MIIKELEGNIQSIIQKSKGNISILFVCGEEVVKIDDKRQVRAASVIKVPILIEAFRQIEEGKIDPNEIFHIKENQKVPGTGVINYLSNSTTYTFRNLLELMMIVSDNTASNIVLNTIGFDNVMRLAELLGCKDTRVEREFMDEEAVKSGLDNRVTALDMLQYLKVIGEANNVIGKQSREQMLEILANQQYRQKLPAYYNPNSGLDFYNKTGELSNVEHDVGILKYDSKIAYVAVLSDGWTHNYEGQHALSEIGKSIMDYMIK